ncbi:hypothetical protein L1D14_25500 [Vibrio tubiashii]|uniref:hypothetical protein n=1 Tax=Vibrio tubiashii TaxID=29498 RepID=UPI001EFC99B5|nr:hypothetical protein [Vibrio tubiashii]MCG9579567.1 hypothetical protein [Vibrio tubiashii]
MNSSIPFITRDKVNFFAHVGEVYPHKSITEHKSRMLMSLFQTNKAYIVLKTADIRQSTDVSAVSAKLYRKDSMLMLGLSFESKNDRSCFSMLPVNAIRDALVSPNYPSKGQPMEIEVHFIEYLNGDKLNKVLRFSIDDDEFTQKLASEYESQRKSAVDAETMAIDTKVLATMPYVLLDKFLLASSTATIIKDTPIENEPYELSIESRNAYDVISV